MNAIPCFLIEEVVYIKKMGLAHLFNIFKKLCHFYQNSIAKHMLQMVLAHEIGHDTYPRDLARRGLQEFTLFHMKNDTEYVANAFGAHLLLDNDEVLELARSGCDVVQIAKTLNSDINLLLIKMQEMNKMGYNFNVPCSPESDFFKKIRV